MTQIASKKSRSEWNSDDSRKEMSKWVNAATSGAATSVASDVQESLSENMWYFIDNIGDRCCRYREAMNNVAAKNPNNHFTPEQLESSLWIENEDQFFSVSLRRYVTVAADNEEGDAPTDNDSAKKHVDPVATTEGSVETEEKPANSGSPVPGNEADEDDDDDDEDGYDAVEEVDVKFPSNNELRNEMALLKQAGSELATVFEGISDWIALSVPDIKVDDNDSVDIMKSVMDAIDAHCEAVRSTVTFQRDYLDERADMEVDVVNFPHAPSLRRQLIINDLESWSEVERGWQTLTRCALIAHTLLTKNMRKLLNARNSSRSAGIYQ